MNQTSQLLNFQAPMAYMPPDVGATFPIAAYVMIGSLGAFLWDIIANIDSDYRLLFQHQMSFPTALYFFSRLASLIGITVDAIFWVAPLGLKTCRTILITACALYHTAFAATTFLFFLRVRAIFNRDRYIVAAFAALWLALVGSSLVAASPILYTAASPVMLFVYDTCVFLAISWRLLLSARVPSDGKENPSILRFILGQGLPTFTRSLTQDGQVYYLISILANVVAIIIAIHPACSGFGHTYVVNAVVANMMGCRVYRRTKFGYFREEEISTASIQAQRGIEQSTITGTAPRSAVCKAKCTNGDVKYRWQEKLRFRFLLALIVVCLTAVPAVSISMCTTRRRQPSYFS